MTPTDCTSAAEDTFQDAIAEKLADADSDSYRRNMEMVLRGFAVFAHEQGVTSPSNITPELCREYALSLRDDALDIETQFAMSSAQRYYAYVRAFLSTCVVTGRLESNPAKDPTAAEVLRQQDSDPDKGTWTAAQRRELREYLDTAAREAAAGELSQTERRRALRDRAFVYLLAFAPIDGVESLRWGALEGDSGDLTAGVGDGSDDAEVGSERILQALEAHSEAQSPPSAEWPVFPTWHNPTLVQAARSDLQAKEIAGDIEEILDSSDIWAVYRDYNLVPPALTENGARHIMRRLCEDADITPDGPFLRPDEVDEETADSP